MAFCRNCGHEIHDEAVVCTHCGVPQTVKRNSNVNDDGNISWGLLGFCVPIVGLILYLVWKDDQPNNAKIAGKGALISTVVSIIVSIIYIVIMVMVLDQAYNF